MPPRIEVLPGEKRGMLTVIREIEPRIRKNGDPRRVLLCVCDCGTEKEILFQSFTINRVVSCGCYQRKTVKEGCFAKKHGLSSHPIFSVWRAMKNRCYDPKHKGYKYYGGRGIIVCDDWKNNPKSFIEWCEINGWREDLQIDRINNNGNYEPSNCRIVTPYQNLMNRSCTIWR